MSFSRSSSAYLLSQGRPTSNVGWTSWHLWQHMTSWQLKQPRPVPSPCQHLPHQQLTPHPHPWIPTLPPLNP